MKKCVERISKGRYALAIVLVILSCSLMHAQQTIPDQVCVKITANDQIATALSVSDYQYKRITLILTANISESVAIPNGRDVTILMSADKTLTGDITNAGTLYMEGLSGTYSGTITNQSTGQLTILSGQYSGTLTNQSSAEGSLRVLGGNFAYDVASYCLSGFTTAKVKDAAGNWSRYTVCADVTKLYAATDYFVQYDRKALSYDNSRRVLLVQQNGVNADRFKWRIQPETSTTYINNNYKCTGTPTEDGAKYYWLTNSHYQQHLGYQQASVCYVAAHSNDRTNPYEIKWNANTRGYSLLSPYLYWGEEQRYYMAAPASGDLTAGHLQGSGYGEGTKPPTIESDSDPDAHWYFVESYYSACMAALERAENFVADSNEKVVPYHPALKEAIYLAKTGTEDYATKYNRLSALNRAASGSILEEGHFYQLKNNSTSKYIGSAQSGTLPLVDDVSLATIYKYDNGHLVSVSTGKAIQNASAADVASASTFTVEMSTIGDFSKINLTIKTNSNQYLYANGTSLAAASTLPASDAAYSWQLIEYHPLSYDSVDANGEWGVYGDSMPQLRDFEFVLRQSEATGINFLNLTGVHSFGEGVTPEAIRTAVSTAAAGNMLILSAQSSSSANILTAQEDGATCATLTLTDGANLYSPVAFTAASATYSRAMASTARYGTICLPYAVSSVQGVVQYYVMERISEGVLYLTKVDGLVANTPAVFEVPAGQTLQASATDVSVSSASLESKSYNNGQIVAYGTYMDTKISQSDHPNAYYIKSNNFYHVNNYFNLKAFRAYFEFDAPGAGSAPAMLSIETDEEDEQLTTNLQSDEASAGIEGVYNLQGMRFDNLQPGLNIVRYSDGTSLKIMVN